MAFQSSIVNNEIVKKKSVIYWDGCGHHGLDQTLQALIVLPQGSHRLTDRKLAPPKPSWPPPKPRVIAEMRFLCKYSTYTVYLRKIADVQKLIRSGHQTDIYMQDFFSLRIRRNKKLYHEHTNINTGSAKSMCMDSCLPINPATNPTTAYVALLYYGTTRNARNFPKLRALQSFGHALM